MSRDLFILFVAIVSMLAVSCKKEENDPQNPDQPKAKVDSYYLYGFCDKLNVYEIGGIGCADSCRVAVCFTGSELSAKGTHIGGVRFYVADGATKGQALVADAAGKILALQDFYVSEPGWQVQQFYVPLQIESGKEYFVGFRIEGTDYSVGVDTVRDSDRDETSFVFNGSGWTSFRSFGLEDKFLSVEALCQGGDYSAEPQHEYVVTKCDFPDSVKVSQKVDFNLTVMTFGIKTTGKLTLTCVCGKEVLKANVSGLINGQPKILNFTLEQVDSAMTEIRYEVTEDGVIEKYSGGKSVVVSN